MSRWLCARRPRGSSECVVLGLSLVLTLGAAAETTGAEIRGLVPVVRVDGIIVSFRVDGAFTDEIAHAIETGLEVSFRYNIELKRVRRAWLDQKLAAKQIRTTVTYDNLTKRYSLTREVDGEIDATTVVADVSAMQRFMTEFESLPLFDLSRMVPNEEYYLRANGVMKDRNLLLFIPWDVGAGWREAHFTYLPPAGLASHPFRSASRTFGPASR